MSVYPDEESFYLAHDNVRCMAALRRNAWLRRLWVTLRVALLVLTLLVVACGDGDSLPGPDPDASVDTPVDAQQLDAQAIASCASLGCVLEHPERVVDPDCLLTGALCQCITEPEGAAVACVP